MPKKFEYIWKEKQPIKCSKCGDYITSQVWYHSPLPKFVALCNDCLESKKEILECNECREIVPINVWYEYGLEDLVIICDSCWELGKKLHQCNYCWNDYSQNEQWAKENGYPYSNVKGGYKNYYDFCSEKCKDTYIKQ